MINWAQPSLFHHGGNSLSVETSIPSWEKLGQEDRKAGLTICMGSYGSSKRNANGEALVAFMCAKGLFATNTAFKHPCRHQTTWTGHFVDRKVVAGSKATRAVFNKTNFVLCKVEAKRLLRDLRSYGDADLNSDHKPVIRRLQMNHMYLVYKCQPSQKGRVIYDLAKLVTSNSTQEDYHNALDEKLAEINLDCDPNNGLTEVLKCVETSAASNIGVIKNNKNWAGRLTDDPLVVKFSEWQKALQLRIYQSSKSKDCTTLGKECNNILCQISKHLRDFSILQADSPVDTKSTTDDCQKMFRAAWWHQQWISEVCKWYHIQANHRHHQLCHCKTSSNQSCGVVYTHRIAQT